MNHIQLPVAYNQVDNTYFNQQLPQGNDVILPVQFLPGQDQQSAYYLQGVIRALAQSRSQRTPMHAFTYNILQQNKFQNQIWSMWMQFATEFLDFLIRGQGLQVQTAVDKAAARVYQGIMASLFSQYPALSQFIGQDIIAGLQDAGRVLQSMQQDTQTWKQRVMQGMTGSMPGMTTMQPMMSTIGQFAVNPTPQNKPVSSGAYGMLMGGQETTTVPIPAQRTTATPTSSWTGNSGFLEPIAKEQPAQLVTPQALPQQPMQVAVMDSAVQSDLPVPSNVTELVMKPDYYVPEGVVINKDRPFDRFYNPGGIEIRPTYQARDWKRTRNDAARYAKVYDVNTEIAFLVRWPDGIIEEHIVTFEPEMDYLKHEINEQLRLKAHRPKGIVVMDDKYIQVDDIKNGVDIEQAEKEALIDKEAALKNPIVLTTAFTGSTDLMNETDAAAMIRERLGLGAKDPLPPHEYHSIRLFEIGNDETLVDGLERASECQTIEAVSEKLLGLLNEGSLSLRLYRFIAERLTKEANQFIKDGLGIEKLRIDDFIEDGVALLGVLAKRDTRMVEMFKKTVPRMIERALAVMPAHDGEVETYAIIDRYVNLQLHVTSEELSNLNLTEEACLVTRRANRVLLEALHGLMERLKASEEKPYMVNRRLITSDGVYLKVISGVWTEGSLLLKREH